MKKTYTLLLLAVILPLATIIISCDPPGPTIEPMPTISLNKNNLTLEIGTQERLTASFDPADTESKGHTWSSSDASIASVDDAGLVTAEGIGEAEITATALLGGSTSTCKVSVVKKKISVNSITLDITAKTLAAGETVQLTATVLPDDASNKSIEWYSDDEEVATVTDDGLVTARSVGVAKITAVTIDGSEKYATCEIYVAENSTDFSDLECTAYATTSATIKGAVTSIGLKLSEYGVCYSTRQNPTVNENKKRAFEKTFTVELNNLTENTTYYAKLYAITDNGEVYYSNNEISFTTLESLKTNFTLTDVYPDKVELVSPAPNGYNSVNVCYGDKPNPKITDNTATATVEADGNFHLTLTTKYNTMYVRSYEMKGGTAIYNDDEVSFKTDEITIEFIDKVYSRQDNRISTYFKCSIFTDGIHEISTNGGVSKTQSSYQNSIYVEPGEDITIYYLTPKYNTWYIRKENPKYYYYYGKVSDDLQVRNIETNKTYHFNQSHDYFLFSDTWSY